MLKNNKTTFAGASIFLGWTVLLSSLTPNAQAATFTYTGTTVGAPTWNRPAADPSGLIAGISGVSGEAVPYNSFGFTVSAPDSYVFQSTATFDNYTFLYQNSFNPTLGNELKNIIIGNDDYLGIPGSKSGFTTALNPGINYFLVTTGFENSNIGTFSNTITGAGNVSRINATSVPEPATILGSLAAFSYGIYARRKMKLAQSIDKETF
jgi:hypothetical protein